LEEIPFMRMVANSPLGYCIVTPCTVTGLSWTLFILNVVAFYRTAIVVYQLFYRMVLGTTFDAGSIIKFLSEVSLGAYVE
jgi:hypothetical protein